MKKSILIFIFLPLCITSFSCNHQQETVAIDAKVDTQKNTTTSVVYRTADSTAVEEPYTNLIFFKKQELNAAPGTKSVLFNSNSSRLYAMNLEGMSVYEFDQVTKKLERMFQFKPSRGIGWDYTKQRPISSFQEKPVEGCISHNNTILWVSLHNADGIVPIFLKNRPKAINKTINPNLVQKKVFEINLLSNKKDSFFTPLIATGKTPKVISKTGDDQFLLVTNWHGHSISILQTDTSKLPYATKLKDLQVTTIPRGMVIDDKAAKSYVAQMGGAEITVINNAVWQLQKPIQVATNPRHIVMDTMGRLYVSYNQLNRIACVDAATGNTLFTAATGSQPRTIILSKNKQFIFVTCYASDEVNLYKIMPDSFIKIAALPCKGSPVGVDLYEDNNVLEAWVCQYVTGNITVFSFKKERAEMMK